MVRGEYVGAKVISAVVVGSTARSLVCEAERKDVDAKTGDMMDRWVGATGRETAGIIGIKIEEIFGGSEGGLGWSPVAEKSLVL